MHIPRAAAALIVVLAAALPVRAAEPVTFSKDVAPILFRRCTSCHRPGEIGPFSLQTYRDARQRMTLIADTTKRRVMPPWKVESAPGTFIDDRSLTPSELQTIQDWAAQDGPEGNPADLPPLPAFADG